MVQKGLLQPVEVEDDSTVEEGIAEILRLVVIPASDTPTTDNHLLARGPLTEYYLQYSLEASE